MRLNRIYESCSFLNLNDDALRKAQEVQVNRRERVFNNKCSVQTKHFQRKGNLDIGDESFKKYHIISPTS
jgi:hypothetical protein